MALAAGKKEETVDLKMSVVKPLGARWLKEVYDYMLLNPNIIINGFRGAGIFK